MQILVVNAGSSSMKFGLYDFDSLEPVARGLLDWRGESHRATITITPSHGDRIETQRDVLDYRRGAVEALRLLGQHQLTGDDGSSIRVVGHRLIHGGEEIREPVRIDAAMKEHILRFTHLAPLHIPAVIQAIEACEEALEGVPQTGLFDTAFFGSIPPAAYIYPVPYDWYRDWGIRRFGFHGTSHAYCTERATQMLDEDPAQLRLVLCHLGQGASATAVRGGKAVDNTMGYTPLEGLMMGTRSGSVDPGILIHVQREFGLSADALDDALNKKSGLLGVSGLTSDFRELEAAAAGGHERAQLALEVYAYRVRAVVGALSVSLGGLDALVFTGGIGENAAGLRAMVCSGLECLGVYLDPARNAAGKADCDVATDGSAARVLLIHTREETMIAREARRLVLAAGSSTSS
ncbi:MAG: acetate/propionate family kinase [Pirellulaceae bacterium]